jgi:hypothetical protein
VEEGQHLDPATAPSSSTVQMRERCPRILALPLVPPPPAMLPCAIRAGEGKEEREHRVPPEQGKGRERWSVAPRRAPLEVVEAD